MILPNHINPDHYLETPEGRVDSPERGKAAWQQAYAELSGRLSVVGSQGALYIVCGIQGSGKSTWVRRNAPALSSDAVFFDAALPSQKHRSRALGMAAITGTPATAIWINVPIEVALERNAERPEGERVPEHIIHHVLEQLEPPSRAEGFVEVIEIDARGQRR